MYHCVQSLAGDILTILKAGSQAYAGDILTILKAGSQAYAGDILTILKTGTCSQASNVLQHSSTPRRKVDLSQHSLVQTLASFPSSVTLQFKWTASNYLITTEKEMLFCNFVRPPNMHSFVSTHPSGTHSLQLVFIAIVTGYCDMHDLQFTGNWSRWNTALLCQCV